MPRSRYDIELFDKYMKLHGKTFDYKCLYTNVSALYLLPKQGFGFGFGLPNNTLT